MQLFQMHAEIRYSEQLNSYVVKDHASQNGTFINSARISQPKMMSKAIQLFHGDNIQLGGTVLVLHMHPGNETCDECEPGNVQALIQKEQKEAAAESKGPSTSK